MYIESHEVLHIQPWEQTGSVFAATYWHFVGMTICCVATGEGLRLMKLLDPAPFHHACRGSVVHLSSREASLGGDHGETGEISDESDGSGEFRMAETEPKRRIREQ